MAKVGFIGLGIIGSGIVKNLLKAGHEVTVWNRTTATVAELKALGAKSVADPAELMDGFDYFAYCLADDSAIADVIIGGRELAKKVNSRTVVIDFSTIDPQTSLTEHAIYEARGVKFLDAPVFGTKCEANNGGLWIVIGGAESVFIATKEILEPISETLHYMGKGGNGAMMKLVGNLLVVSQLLSLGEALTMAKKAGLNLKDVLGVAAVADFRTPIYDGVGVGVLADDYEVNFPLRLMLKDAKLMQIFGARLGTSVSIADAVRPFLEEGVANGMGELNASALIKVMADKIGVNLNDK
jgi:3-hydroxyisobutyrate dehydrogenase-like beta-hydroxyacid dehydrogenase